MSQIKFQDVLRDAVQSLFGTNPSAQEIIDSYPTAHLTGTPALNPLAHTFIAMELVMAIFEIPLNRQS